MLPRFPRLPYQLIALGVVVAFVGLFAFIAAGPIGPLTVAAGYAVGWAIADD